MAGRLPNGSPILLHCDLQCANKKLDESSPVHNAVAAWVKIIKEKGHLNTILVFDSYYFSAKSRQLLLENDVKACAAVTINKFKEAVDLVNRRIFQPGDIEAVFNESYGEFVLGYFNPNPQVTIVPFALFSL